MKNKSKELQIALDAAKAGAKKALYYYNKKLEFNKKDDGSIVSQADFETEEVIKKSILEKEKDAEFLAEESGGDAYKSRLWIIDPIDGTRCFSRGIPFWCVIVSLFERDDVQLSVCYFPLLENGLYFAEKGKGAFCEKEKLSVSKISNMHDAYLTIGSLRHFTNIDGLMKVVHATNGTRGYEPTYGSCLLTQGKVDVGVDVYAHPWDAAPFKVMVEEAGGKITFMDGTPWTIHGQGFIATNGILHDQVIKLYNS